MCKKDEVNAILRKIANGGRKSEEDLKSEINAETAHIEDYKARMKVAFDKIKRANEDLMRLRQNDTDFYTLIYDIGNNKKVKKVELDVDNALIKAETTTLYARARNGGVYLVGRYNIEFDIRTSKVQFFNLDEDNKRRSYWSDKDQHPHVSSTGNACLGNSSEMIAYLASEFEYQALFDILIGFLEQVNLDDCAGQHALNWIKVDAITHETIGGGYRDASGDDFYYDYDDHTLDSYDEEKSHEGKAYCDICESWHDEDDVQYVSSVEQHVCNECLDGFYWCSCCEEYHSHDDVTYVESASEYVCDDCLTEHYFQCDNCGEWFDKDRRYLDENENELCKECFDEREDKE